MIRAYDITRWFFKLRSAMAVALLAIAAPAAARTVSILAFGDSLTAGYQLPPADSFPAQLQTALQARGYKATVHNAGVSGDTTTGGRARLDWVMKGLASKPDLVIVELGANDSLRGIDPAITRANLDALVTKLVAGGHKVLIAGMLAPPNLGADYGTKYNRIFPELAKKHNAALYPFFMDGVVLQPKLQLADGMHPSRAGVGVIVQRILPVVLKNLPPKE